MASSADTTTRVKQETDSAAASPAAMSEDDVYEDAGDLEFPKQEQAAYLMRLPKFLWERWADLKDDDEIQLGLIRVESTGSGNPQKLTLLLSEETANKGLPREYDMNITNQTSNNTFVFTEKDLPEYAEKSKAKAAAANGKFPTIPSRLLHDREKSSSYEPRSKGKRYQPYFRKAVPKQTAIAGIIKHEVNCNPVENEEFSRYLAAQAKAALQPKRETKMLQGDPGMSSILHPGLLGPGPGFTSFIKPNQPSIKKTIDQRAARIPRNELLDLIFDCFKEYSYWPMKALKARLNQPEPYLKEVLGDIAELVKSGRFAMTWTLKPDLRHGAYEQVEGQAPDVGNLYDSASEGAEMSKSEDEDEDNVKMEDVLPAQ